MKEQDAAHSLDDTLKTAEDYWYEYSHESIVEGLRGITEANFKQAIRMCQQDTIKYELTRLRSELQQKDEIIKDLLPLAERMGGVLGTYANEHYKASIERAYESIKKQS